MVRSKGMNMDLPRTRDDPTNKNIHPLLHPPRDISFSISKSDIDLMWWENQRLKLRMDNLEKDMAILFAEIKNIKYRVVGCMNIP
jgi:hypothetical protein